MADPKRITEVTLETLRDIALSYGIAVLAIPYLLGCSRIGEIQPWIAYAGICAFAISLSTISVLRWLTDIGRRFKRQRNYAVWAILVGAPVAFGNAAGIWFVTDLEYHPATKNQRVDSIVEQIIDRKAYFNRCAAPH